MNIEFWIGLVAGMAIMWIVREIWSAFDGRTIDEQKLSRCAIEAARRVATVRVNNFSDEVIVGRMQAGLEGLPKGDPESR